MAGCVLLAGLGYGLAAWAAVWWCALVLGGGPTATSRGALVLLAAAAAALALCIGLWHRPRWAFASILAALPFWYYRPPLASYTCTRLAVGFIGCFAISLPSFHVLAAAVGGRVREARAIGTRPAAFMSLGGLGVAFALFVCVPGMGIRATMALGFALALVADAVLWAAARLESELPGTSTPLGRLVATLFFYAVAFGCGLALTMRLMRCQVPVTAHSAGITTIWLLTSGALSWWIGASVARQPDRANPWVAAGLLASSLTLACWVAMAPSMASFAGEVVASAGSSWPLILLALSVATATYGVISGALAGFVLSAECGLALRRAAPRARCAHLCLATIAAGVACGVGAADFVVIGSVGLTDGFLLAGLAMLGLGGWRVCRLQNVRPKVRGLICAASVMAFLSFFGVSNPSDPTVVSSATTWPSAKGILAKRLTPDPRQRTRKEPPAPELLFHAVSEHGWLGVAQGDDGARRLVVDGIEVSSTGKPDVMLSAMLAHVPASLCSAKKRALQLGVRDAGVLAALVSHGFAEIDCIEPRPGLLEAAQWLGQAQNVVSPNAANVLAQPPKTTVGRYDVIVSCPHARWPWTASAAYSRDYFELCDVRLAHGGVCATWLPLRRIEMSTLRDVVRSFSDVFEHTCLWLALDHVVLAGARVPLALSVEAMAARFSLATVRQRLKQDGSTAAVQLWSRLLMATEDVKELTGTGPVLRLDRPTAELRAARSMPLQTFTRNLLLVSQYRNTVFQRLTAPGELFDRLAREFDRTSVDIAHYAQLKTKEDDELFEQLLFEGKIGPRAVCPLTPGPAAYKANGVICFGIGFHLGAYRLLKKALYDGGDFKDAELRYYLGAACLRLKEYEEAQRHLKRALMNDPHLGRAHLEMAQLHLAKGKPDAAIDHVLKGLEIDQDLAGAHTLLGIIYGRHLRDYRNGALHFEIALVKDPNDNIAADNLRLLAPKRWRKWKGEQKGAAEERKAQ